MDHAPGGDSLEVAAQVQGDGGFERGNGQLVDAQGAEQRVLADSRQRLALAGDDAGLRAAQQLVAAEGGYVDARLEARRSGERRVGEEGRSRWSPCHLKKKKKKK